MDPTENTQSDLPVWLTPDDMETAQVAGIRFARALAGVLNTAFMVALGEQQDFVRMAVLEAGVSARNAVRIALPLRPAQSWNGTAWRPCGNKRRWAMHD